MVDHRLHAGRTGAARPIRRTDMTRDDDMTAPPEEPDSGTPADLAEGTVDDGADLGADGGADGGADEGNDPTTETEEDPRLA
jgi:hypothetical protein